MFSKGPISVLDSGGAAKHGGSGDAWVNRFEVEEHKKVEEVTKTLMCSNYNCPSMMVKDLYTEEIYCSVDCHRDYVGILAGNQAFNVVESNLVRLGRGGTGLLAERDNIVVSFNAKSGLRRSTWYTVPSPIDQLSRNRGSGPLLNKIEKMFSKANQCHKSSPLITGNSSAQPEKIEKKVDFVSAVLPLISVSQELQLFQKYLVVVVFAVNPWEIYVQTEESSKRAQEIQNWCNEGLDPAWKSPHWKPVVGQFCIAGYKGERYRAKILKISDEFIEVHYVDYGNTSLVNWDQVSELGLKLLQIVPQCFQIKIANIKPGDNRSYWNEDSITRVKSLENTLMYVEPIMKDLSDPNVMLSRMNKASLEGMMLGNFGDKLIVDGLALRDDYVTEVAKKTILFEPESLSPIAKRSLLPERETQVKLGHIESPSLFYVIMDTAEHSKMKTRMAKYVMLKKIFFSPKMGEFCGAKFSNQWKRAKKIADHNDMIEVISTDDGEKAVVPPLDIIKLKKDMLDTPQLAIRCSLHNLEAIDGQWTKDAISSLKKLTAEVPCFVEPVELDAENSFVKLLIGEGKQDFGKILVDLGLAIEKTPSCSLLTKNNEKKSSNEYSVNTDGVIESQLEVLSIQSDDSTCKKSGRKSETFTISDIPTMKFGNDDSVFVSNFLGFNRCYVQTFEGAENLLDLHDQIASTISNAKPLAELPTTGEIVLGTLLDGINYLRAVVVKVESDTIARIKFIDVGSENSLHYSDLRCPTAEMIKVPITGSEVLLSGIPDNPKEILTEDFNSYCSKLTKNLRIQIVNEGVDEMVECKLYHLKDKNRCVNEEILKLGQWKWEIAFKIGKLTDDDIFAYEGKFPSYYYSLHPVEIPLGEEIQLQVALYSDPKTFMCIPRIPSLERDFKVMETQMNSYLNAVKESAFFPTVNELYFSRRNNGKWMRCARFSDQFGALAIDFGTAFRFDTADNDMRRMPKDFVRIPTFAVACVLDGIPETLDSKMEKIIKGVLRHRKVLTCIATARCKVTNMYSIKCNDVIKALADGGGEEI